MVIRKVNILMKRKKTHRKKASKFDVKFVIELADLNKLLSGAPFKPISGFRWEFYLSEAHGRT
jgi:hypothetical protein